MTLTSTSVRIGRAGAAVVSLSAFVGLIWYWYLTVPVVPWVGISGMRIAGLAGGLLLGGLCREVSRSFTMAAGSAAAGLVGGAAYAEWHFSGVSLGLWGAVQGGLRLMSLYGIQVLLAVAAGWIVLDRLHALRTRRAMSQASKGAAGRPTRG